jgi:DNA-binding CsgD family transcriptional regulator
MKVKSKERKRSRELGRFNDKDFEEFSSLLKRLTKRYNLSSLELVQKVEKAGYVPVNIFNKVLSPLETVTKYMRENLNYSNKKIAKVLNRSEKTIWQAYNSSMKKQATRFRAEIPEYVVDISILNDRRFSILELVVSYLKEYYNLTYHFIASLLQRDDRTIWTVYNRAQKKRGRA